ncbi:AI-2E family transporter [Halobacteriovorax sp. HLS]|uniref:AI-2E family transporter n=1 Tax=Halobacteriovorax sp. HLS TaxID=2234000 RepID=UPI000FD797F8|nr:AI-2E family transporter [Halobacteriovorax sp. HLS]
MPSNSYKKTEKVRIVIFISILVLIFLSLSFFPRVAVPITVAYVISLIFKPWIPLAMRLGLGRSTSVYLVFIGILFLFTYPLVRVTPIITKEAQNLQYYLPKVEVFLKKEYSYATDKIEAKTGYKVGNEFLIDTLKYSKDTTTDILLKVPQILGSVLEWVFLVPLFVFFMLKDGGKFKSKFLKIVPNSIFERVYYLSHQFNKQLGDYIFAKFIEASIVCTIITAGLLVLDVRFALILGLVAGFTNIIPYLGPILGTVPAIIFAMAEYGMGSTFGAITILYIAANAIDIALVFPILVSKIVNLHPLIVVISVILGSSFFGVLGMVVSIPVAAAVKLIFSEVYNEFYAAKAQ